MTVMVWMPRATPVNGWLVAQGAKFVPSKVQMYVPIGWVDVKVRTKLVPTVLPLAGDWMVTTGAVSTVNVLHACGPTLPAASVAWTQNVFVEPSGKLG